jgi:predicted PhzF superfamily epimerase YddE/YHI9
LGNPVAIVNLTEQDLSTQTKQQIAREFNFSETVFLNNVSLDQKATPQFEVQIFTPVNEMEFAGHPVIGLGHFLFRQMLRDNNQRTINVLTRAGPVAISYDAENAVVSAQVTHNIHIHRTEATLDRILAVQPALRTHSNLQGAEGAAPVVSIVRGLSYILKDLSARPDIFAALKPGANPTIDLDEDWAPSFTGIMYYRFVSSDDRAGIDEQDGGQDETTIWNLAVRMMAIDIEDPACGSGACTLAAYIALNNSQRGRSHHFLIGQGVEMGRESRIIVKILLNEERSRVEEIRLAGQAVFVAEGVIAVN